jgi:hypothetical protein
MLIKYSGCSDRLAPLFIFLSRENFAYLFRRQIREDIDLMVTSCPNLRKVNIVVHYKNAIMDDTHSQVSNLYVRYSKI